MTLGEADRRVLPARAGIGLRPPHVAEVLATHSSAGWFEVHPENYMGGGPAVRALDQIRGRYPLSLHGVGLSLGSARGLDPRHLERLRLLVERLDPALVSEHLAWSTAGGHYLNHLLPLPLTDESLALVSDNVDLAQERLGRRILVENPSSYLAFRDSPIPEPEFLAALARRTGCRLLCDINNVYVSAHNLDGDPVAYLDALPPEAVAEIHLAGHARNVADGRTILIDDHGSRVAGAVWALYGHALRRFGSVPTLIEWDTDVPALSVLLGEAAAADGMLDGAHVEASGAFSR